MTHHSCVVERIGTREPGYAWTCDAEVGETAPQSRWSARRADPGLSRRSTKTRGACENIRFYARYKGCQRVNCPRRVWSTPLVPTAVTPGMSIDLATLAICLLTSFTYQRGPRAVMGVALRRVRRFGSPYFGQFRPIAQSRAWVLRRSTPQQLLDSPQLAIGLESDELSQDLAPTQISPLKREAMMPPRRRRLVKLQGAVDIEGGQRQALHRPSRSLPIAVVARRHGSLPTGVADIAHLPLPLDRVRARRDLQSPRSHATPSRR
jgi:hypothetical protein